MVVKKAGKDMGAKKDVQTKTKKMQRGVRFLSLFSGEGANFVFRCYPTREETSVKVETSDQELGKMIRKIYQEFKSQAK